MIGLSASGLPTHFRAIKGAVSLKRFVIVRLKRCLDGFPRHQRRGLIEAILSTVVPSLPRKFPRHQRRGLIEAGHRPHHGFYRLEDFRAIKGAVSLKLDGSWRGGSVDGMDFRAIKGAVSLKHSNISDNYSANTQFPRHQRRGLIEARKSSAGYLAPRKFPRHQRRGLIEARCPPCRGRF